ncbi:MAG: RluA family pseudouridine synthase [Candidatus Magasanikbacteria bacterium]
MLKQSKNWTAETQDEDKRLDIFLTERLDTSRNQIQKRIEMGRVEINGDRAEKSGIMLKESDEVTIYPINDKSDQQAKKEREQLNIKVIDESENYIVVEKPSGLLVHPTAKKEKVTLVHWLLDRYPELKTVGEFDDRPGIVHRLDKDTSGLLVVARNQEMFEHLKKQFKQRKIEKRYTALVHGEIDAKKDTIVFPIARGNDGRMIAKPSGSNSGKRAITKIKIKKALNGYTLLDVQIITGRTHQIKAHLYAYNHPIVGEKHYTQDKRKNNLDKKLDRPFLHARKLCFYDLKNGKICNTSKLPDKLQGVINDLE